jgi:hypothetical protein
MGFAALFVFNAAGGSLGLSVGLNIVNAGVIGLLGLPGFALLFALDTIDKKGNDALALGSSNEKKQPVFDVKRPAAGQIPARRCSYSLEAADVNDAHFNRRLGGHTL